MAVENLRKRDLISTVIPLGVSVTMLIGTTLAWFTDTATSRGNIIDSGTLKIDLIHHDDNGDVSIKNTPEHKIFNYDKWEPGYTQIETLTIKNEGDLALQYVMSAAISGNVEKGINNKKLSDVIDVYMSFGENTASSIEDLSNNNIWWKIGTLTEWLDNENLTSGKIIPEGEEGADLSQGITEGYCTVSVALHMRESATNEYQGLSLGDIDLVLNATQWTYESDSFGNNYDLLAELEIKSEGTVGELTIISDGIAVDKQGNYAVYKPAGLIKYRDMMDEKKDFKNKTVYLLNDLDMTGYEWDTINSAHYESGSKIGGMIFDGHGHKISNLVINGAGLFDLVALDNTLTFKNVTFDKVTTDQDFNNQFRGVFVGNLYSDIQFDQVTVSNSQINGYWGIGAFVGMAGNENKVNVTIKDSHVTNFTITAPWNYYTSSFVGCLGDKSTITFNGINKVNNFIVKVTSSLSDNYTGGSIHTNVSTHPNVEVNGYEVIK